MAKKTVSWKQMFTCFAYTQRLSIFVDGHIPIMRSKMTICFVKRTPLFIKKNMLHLSVKNGPKWHLVHFNIWLVGGLEHVLCFHILGNNHSNWLILFGGVVQPPTRYALLFPIRIITHVTHPSIIMSFPVQWRHVSRFGASKGQQTPWTCTVSKRLGFPGATIATCTHWFPPMPMIGGGNPHRLARAGQIWHRCFSYVVGTQWPQNHAPEVIFVGIIWTSFCRGQPPKLPTRHQPCHVSRQGLVQRITLNLEKTRKNVSSIQVSSD